MKSLYDSITSLGKKKTELNTQLKNLKIAIELGDVPASDEYDDVMAEIECVKSQLADIEKKYAIGVDEMAKIISDATGKHYKPKFFREVVREDGRIICSYSFVACYINENNMYYIDPYREILLKEGAYHKLLDDIDARNGIVQFSGSEMFEDEQLNLKEIYENINFIKMFTQPKTNTEVSNGFAKNVAPLLTKHLQSIKVASVDENLGNGF